MFKRRSSKDLSTKIGYDHVNGKASRHPSISDTSVAPVVIIPPGHQKQASFSSSSSYQKTTGMPSPDGDGEEPANNSRGPSPLAALKSLPTSTQELSPQQEYGIAASTTSSTTKAPTKSKSAATPPKQVVAEPPSQSLVIGEGVLFEGSTEGCAAAVVGGKLVGTVNSKRLEITRAGRMEGTATVETAEIAGNFEGNLRVTKALKICSTGRFKGELSFGSIVVENGGKLEGKVNFGGCREPMPKESDVPPPPSVSHSKKKAVSSPPPATPPQPVAPAATVPAAPAPSKASPKTSPKAFAPKAAALPSSGRQARPVPVMDGRHSPE